MIMDLSQGSKATILKQIGISVTDPTLWLFSPILLPTPSDQVVTKVKITPDKYNVAYTGSKTFIYNRLDLAQVVASSPVLTIDCSVGDSILNYLDDIKNLLGISFSSDDLIDSDIQSTDDPSIKQVVLTAKHTSLLWIGTATFSIYPPPSVADYLGTSTFVWNTL